MAQVEKFKVVQDGCVFRWQRRGRCVWDSREAWTDRTEALLATVEVADMYGGELELEDAFDRGMMAAINGGSDAGLDAEGRAGYFHGELLMALAGDALPTLYNEMEAVIHEKEYTPGLGVDPYHLELEV